MRTLRRTVRWSAVLLSCVALMSPAGAARAQMAAASAAVPVVLALEPFVPLEEGASEWLSLFSRALESPQASQGLPLDVRDALVLEPRLLVEGGASLGERHFQQRAQRSGARFVVVGRIARLAQQYSLDVRVLGVPRMQGLGHFIYEGEGAAGLSEAISEAAANKIILRVIHITCHQLFPCPIYKNLIV